PKALPVGISRRRRLGTDMLGVNCALCHAGTVRDTEDGEATVINGMPPQQVDVQRFIRFLFECVDSTQFNAARVIARMEKSSPLDWMLSEGRVRLLVPRIRGQVRDREEKIGLLTSTRVPASGPGRLDTINPGKAVEVGWNLAAVLESSQKDELI